MTITPIAVSLAEELAQRERFLQETREARIADAQRLLKQCFPPTELRLVNRLVEYRTLEGLRRWRKVPTWLEVPA